MVDNIEKRTRIAREQKKYGKLKQNKNSEIEISKDLFGHFLKLYDKVISSYEKEKKPHLKTKKLIQQQYCDRYDQEFFKRHLATYRT